MIIMVRIPWALIKYFSVQFSKIVSVVFAFVPILAFKALKYLFMISTYSF